MDFLGPNPPPQAGEGIFSKTWGNLYVFESELVSALLGRIALVVCWQIGRLWAKNGLCSRIVFVAERDDRP